MDDDEVREMQEQDWRDDMRELEEAKQEYELDAQEFIQPDGKKYNEKEEEA